MAQYSEDIQLMDAPRKRPSYDDEDRGVEGPSHRGIPYNAWLNTIGGRLGSRGAFSLGHDDAPLSKKGSRRLRLALLAFVLGCAWLAFSSVSPTRLHHSSAATSELFSWSPVCPPPEEGHEAIRCHIRRGKAKYDVLVARQSRSVEEAVAYYTRNYARDPPPGFEGWVRYALASDATIIDDYGQLEVDLAPLRAVPAELLRGRMADARKQKLTSLSTWHFKDGKVTTDAPNTSEGARVMLDIMEPIARFLPDFEVMQNWDERQRVCGPPRAGDEGQPLAVRVYSRDQAWASLRVRCPYSEQTRTSAAEDRPTINLCALDASEDRETYGLFNTGGRCLNVTIPILSPAKLSTFQDILMVPWAYASGQRVNDIIHYEAKKPILHWRGSSAGVTPSSDSWYKGHRQRAVMRAHQFQTKARKMKSGEVDRDVVEIPGGLKQLTDAQLEALANTGPDVFDVKFSSLLGCDRDPAMCKEITRHVPTAQPEAPSASLNYRFLLDMDGDSRSPRFYDLLHSNSLVFKQTKFLEYHDDRLVPWYHYVPVSHHLEEMPQLLDFFLNDDEGKQMGADIAKQGTHFVRTASRKVDMTIYTYRQMLELGHILSPGSRH